MAIHGLSVDRWSECVPTFLNACRSLPAWSVVPTGVSHFATGAADLLGWWADYYSRLLEAALANLTYLRYRPQKRLQETVRGRIDWPEQTRVWSRGGYQIACQYRSLTAENTLNNLLGWACEQFMRVGPLGGTRERLRHCLELLGIVPVAPERRGVEAIRLSPVFSSYSGPFEVARALFRSQYPSLRPGSLPAVGLMFDMVTAFEAFIDGLVYRTATRMGTRWVYGSQRQEPLALGSGNTPTYFTRPDNQIFDLHLNRGVVIDAKYKGVTQDLGAPYARPSSSDLYQVVAACLARKWTSAVIVAPAAAPVQVRLHQTWVVPVAKWDRPITVRLVYLDLSDLAGEEGVQRAVSRIEREVRNALAA